MLQIEPFGGIAGDMFLAAALDLADEAFRIEDLRAFAQSLVPGECVLDVKEVRRGAFRGLLLDLKTLETSDPPERHLSELLERLAGSSLGPAAKQWAARIVERLARAEAEVHGSSTDEVHFHEIGAVDTLVDVGGACLALERLGVERVFSAPPYLGGGTVETTHGRLPVPAPGTAALLRGIPTLRGPGGERVTPTGAALLAELVDAFEPAEATAARAIGYGAGARDPAEGPPNLLRLSLGEAVGPAPGRSNSVLLLECNLDDATGEELGFLQGELRRAGALEVWTTAVQMKKDRPGVIVSALARDEERRALEAVFFRHSPTLGVRASRWERVECARDQAVIPFEGRGVRVKVRRVSDAPLRITDVSPEYDDLVDLARASGRTLRELELLVQRAAFEALARA